jgi:hypothetical protein
MAAAEGADTGFMKSRGFVSVLKHCNDVQEIYRPLAVYHEEEYETVPAITAALQDFFGSEYNDRALNDWRIILTIEL